MSDSHSEAMMALGKLLVNELDEYGRRDTLACWMCHHVAERIRDAEASGSTGDIEEARKAVVDLWEHRSILPRESRPLRDFDLIFRTLRAPDPTDPSARYFGIEREIAKTEPGGRDDDEESSAEWLLLAEGMDRAARLLIRECLFRAASASGGNVAKWIAAAEAAGLPVDPDLHAVRLLVRWEPGDRDGVDQAERARLDDLLQKLEAFREMSTMFERDLRERIEDIAVDE